MNNKLLIITIFLTIASLILSACTSAGMPVTPTATTQPVPTFTPLPTSTSIPTPSPTPEPQPGLITFDSNRDGTWGIYMIGADGTGETNLLTIHPNEDSASSWSPDGKKITFFSDLNENSEIYTINADSTGLTRLTNNHAKDTMPAWSPDGQKIVFISDRDGKPNLYIMQSNGSDQKHLTANIDYLYDLFPPSWSPDSQNIAFVAGNPETKLYEIYVINIDGSGLKRLTDEGALNPAWSPDGKKIAFFRPQDGNSDNREIYVMNADGTDKIRITDNPSQNIEPSWSPDSQYIAFSSNRNGNFDIYVMNADGSNVRQLTKDANDEMIPQWSPSGITLSDEPWFGPPYCMRDTDGDFQPDTPTTTFTTNDLVAFVEFPYRNMQNGTQYNHVWKPENGLSIDTTSSWDGGDSGFHTSYSSAPTFGVGKLTIQLFIGDRLVQEVECDVVKP